MTVALKKKADALLAVLKPRERVELADLLYASVPVSYQHGVDAAWKKEIDRRLNEYESGTVTPISAGKVHAGIRRRLNEVKTRRVSTRRAG
jgi:putative addiction module component (TIGR02574 family)